MQHKYRIRGIWSMENIQLWEYIIWSFLIRLSILFIFHLLCFMPPLRLLVRIQQYKNNLSYNMKHHVLESQMPAVNWVKAIKITVVRRTKNIWNARSIRIWRLRPSLMPLGTVLPVRLWLIKMYMQELCTAVFLNKSSFDKHLSYFLGPLYCKPKDGKDDFTGFWGES